MTATPFPVCRARDNTDDSCRRCGADLRLWRKALAALEAAKLRYAAALRSDDPKKISAARRRLAWLSPQAARPSTEGEV